MSKDIPEVGDIFYSEYYNESIYLYKFLEDRNKEKYVRLIILGTYGLFIETFLLKDINFKNMKYLGKSKTKIGDLFKTEDV